MPLCPHRRPAKRSSSEGATPNLLQYRTLRGLKTRMTRLAYILSIFLLSLRPAVAGEVLVATASNFIAAAEELAATFQEGSEHTVVISHGSTGALYAQIVSGAPYDIFLSADAARPRALVDAGLTRDSTTYALGRLVLVSREPVDLAEAPFAFEGARVALADPMVAPYGSAALAAMENLRLDTGTFQPLLVTNVGQVATLFVTGNADLAFLAEGQVPLLGDTEVTALDGRYPPIRQDAALLVRSEGNDAADAFWTFLASEEARTIIAANGYDLSE